MEKRRYVNDNGQTLAVVDGKAYRVKDINLTQHHHHFPTTTNKVYEITKTSSESKRRSWYSTTELKWKKRITKYKLYALEGKVKISIKKGYRWFKKTCSRIIHGF